MWEGKGKSFPHEWDSAAPMLGFLSKLRWAELDSSCSKEAVKEQKAALLSCLAPVSSPGDGEVREAGVQKRRWGEIVEKLSLQ